MEIQTKQRRYRLSRMFFDAMSRAAIALTVAGALVGCAAQPIASTPNVLAIESVRLTAAGHYVDLRYRVVDPEQANAVLGPGIKPSLTDERTGVTMAVPTTAKLGSLRQTQNLQKTDHTYFVLFVNTAQLRPGSRVTAELGSLRFEHLLVQD